MIYLWIGIVILLTIIELITINLTTIWFVISGLITLIISFYVKSFITQFCFFAIVGLILLIVTKPFVEKIMKKRYIRLNEKELLDSIGVVTKEIKKNNYGEVLIAGITYLAYADNKIVKDEQIKVIEVNPNKIKVEII